MIAEVAQYLAGLLLVLGAGFGLLAAIGILRFPDLYTRMHAATKAGALGCGLIFLAVAINSFDAPVILRAIAGIAFLVLTTPVSAHLLARAAYFAGYRPVGWTVVNDLDIDRNN
ncbi:MAG TPA: monovalent cation/H(+) antiporter subunit G [Devosiaceae bacterium]|jgi:multicomponent Na+:H+ antiporter subunit G